MPGEEAIDERVYAYAYGVEDAVRTARLRRKSICYAQQYGMGDRRLAEFELETNPHASWASPNERVSKGGRITKLCSGCSSLDASLGHEENCPLGPVKISASAEHKTEDPGSPEVHTAPNVVQWGTCPGCGSPDPENIHTGDCPTEAALDALMDEEDIT